MLAALGLMLVAFNQRPAVASVPPVLRELDLSVGGASLLVTIPVVCFGLGAFAGPRIRRALGEEWAALILVAVLAAAILVRAVFLGWTLFPATIVIGLCIAVLNVLMPSFVKRRFPDRPGPMMSAYVASATLGPALAAGLTVPIFESSGGSVRLALGVWAALAAVALIAWAPQLRYRGVGATVSGVADDAAGATSPGDGLDRRLTPIWKRALAWQVMVYMGIGSLVFYGPLSWLPEIYQSRGFDAATAGYLLLVMNFVGMIGSGVAPLFGGRRRDQRKVVVVCAVVTLIGLVGLLTGIDSVAYLWAALIGVGTGGQFGLALLLIVVRSADANVASRLSGMAQSGGYLVAATGPLLMGVFHSATSTWWVSITFLVVANLFGLAMGYQAARDRLLRP